MYRYLREQPKWREKNSETVSNGINEKDSNSLSAATTTAAAASKSKKRPPGRDATKMEKNVKRAATAVAKNMSAGVQKNNELQRKLLIELRKARETQEAANEIDVIKYASSSIRQAYADTRAHQLMCKANADKKRAELELIQVTAELAKAKKTMMTDEDEASDVREDDRVRVDHQDLAQDHREGFEGLADGSPKNEDEMQDDGEEDDGREPQDIHSIDAEDAQAAIASATSEGACENRSDQDSLWSVDSEKPSVELRAGDKIQYYEHAHVGRPEWLRTSEVIEVDPSKTYQPLTLECGYTLRTITCGSIRKVSGPDTSWRAIEKFILVKSKTKSLRECMSAASSHFRGILQHNMQQVVKGNNGFTPIDVLQNVARRQSSSVSEDDSDDDETTD